MTSIYRMLQLQFYFSLLVILGAAVFTYKHVDTIQQTKEELVSSAHLQQLIISTRTHAYSKHLSHELQKFRSYTKDKTRAEFISNYIQAYNSSNRLMIEKRQQELLTFEKTWVNEKQQVIDAKGNQLFAIIFGAIFLQVLNIFIYLRVLRKQILNPIDNLSTKINDFMDGSYSYRFTTPADNEIGNLERSFRSMAEEVLKNMEELKALDQAKSEFMNIVSHELRTPMTSIKGSLGLIASGKMGDLSEKVKKLVAIAELESNRLIRLINDFLDLAKIEARSYSLQKNWIALSRIISASVESLKGLQEKANVQLEVLSLPNVEIFADADKIQQVLVNLLSNAMKFTPEQGIVYIQANLHEGKIYIRVRDQGPGISEENQQKIFQKFRQATTPDRPLVKGTGLGLSIAKALVEAHDGKIGVNSKVGEGSEFYFTIADFREIEESKETIAA